jgi:hypothetical protein
MGFYVEDQDEFIRRHGGSPVTLSWGVQLLPSGARTQDMGLGPALLEPPEALLPRLQAQRLYRDTRLKIFEKDFKALKLALMGMGRGFKWNAALYGIPDPLDGIQALRILQKLVLLEREHIATIDAELGQIPEIRAARERAAAAEALGRQIDASRAEREALDQQAIESITI